MAQPYLTPDGFDRPTLPELVQQLGDQLFNALGPINRNPNSGIGQIIGLISEAYEVSYETAEEIFNSRFIRSANGVALDAFGDWLGLPRRSQTNTTSPVILYGEDGTIVPAGAVASYANHNFTIDYNSPITTANTTDTTFRVSTSIAVGEVVAIRVNGINYPVTMAVNMTASAVARELARLITIAGAAGGTSVVFVAVATGADVRITTNNLSIGFSASIANTSAPDRLTQTRIGSPSDVTAVETGSIAVPKGQLVKPVTGISGWTGITNPVDASIGAARESDTDYRKRLQSSDGTVNGLATPAAIKRVLSAVNGVVAVTVLENRSMIPTASGQSAKSYQAVVSGGDPSDIVAAIYSVGGAGIETWGSQQDVYKDPDGVIHLINFERPQAQVYKVTVNVKFLDTEEQLTPTAKQVIEQVVREYFASLSLGEDIIPQRIVGPIYASTTGIALIETTFKTGADVDVPVVDGRIVVGPTYTAVLADTGAVTITGI